MPPLVPQTQRIAISPAMMQHTQGSHLAVLHLVRQHPYHRLRASLCSKEIQLIQGLQGSLQAGRHPEQCVLHHAAPL